MLRVVQNITQRENNRSVWVRKTYVLNYLLCARLFIHFISLNTPTHPMKGLFPSILTEEETEAWTGYAQSLADPMWESVV